MVSTPGIAIIAALLAIPLGVDASENDASPPFVLSERIAHTVEEGAGFFIADVDQNGNDDLLIDRRRALLWLRIKRRSLIPISDGNYRMVGEVIGVYDVSGDSYPEFFVQTQAPEGFLIACHNWFSPDGSADPLYVLGPYLPKRERAKKWPEGAVFIMNVFDADKNGSPEIYMALNINYPGPEPRAVIACDGKTGREIWRYDMGPHLKSCKLLERADKDSRIIISSFAPYNGAVWNETTDSLSYVFCLEPDGTLDWVEPVTGRQAWNDVAVADMDGDGMEEVLVSRIFGDDEVAAARERDQWSVAILDPSDGRIARVAYLHTGTDHPFAVDLDRDFLPEVLLVGKDGQLFILEHDLAVRRIVSDRYHEMIHDVVDIDIDGSNEILCWGSERLMIRDQLGDIKAEALLTDGRRVELADVDEKRHVVTQSGNVVRFYALEESPFSARVSGFFTRSRLSGRGAIAILLVGVGIGVMIVLTAFYTRRFLKRKTSGFALTEEVQDDLLVAMIAFGHGGASLRVLDRLRFHLKNWNEWPSTGPDTNPAADRAADPAANPAANPLVELAGAYKDTVIPELRRIVFLSRRAGVEKEYWGSLVAQASEAETAIESLTGRGARGDSDDATKEVESALANLDAVDRKFAGIGEHLRRVFRSPVVATVCRALSRRQQELEEIGASPKLNVLGAFDDHAHVSPVLFEKALDGLLDNALRAMENSPSPSLEIVVRIEGAYCKIDIKDGGRGVPQGDWDSIFERHFTTKPEGGFGLFYTREELAKYGGKIYVQDSTPREGTTFRIVLRKS